VPPRDLTDPVLQSHLSDETIRETIRHGKGQMPPFGANLADEETADVILYVRTLRRTGP
jgi:mono/diheme cytochrome c family protein